MSWNASFLEWRSSAAHVWTFVVLGADMLKFFNVNWNEEIMAEIMKGKPEKSIQVKTAMVNHRTRSAAWLMIRMKEQEQPLNRVRTPSLCVRMFSMSACVFANGRWWWWLLRQHTWTGWAWTNQSPLYSHAYKIYIGNEFEEWMEKWMNERKKTIEMELRSIRNQINRRPLVIG